ncbi:hypothetical protein [Desulfuromonas acetoxidans]|uniref:hypothetical protein n=1 Tax=Desulfuromonas acetoxidans TaxID=891 RepID=UPI0029300212|nr:hypothetical protein [Desulfuromonas acetoxidans]
MKKKAYKFDDIVLTRATVVQGRDYSAGKVLPIYGENALITEQEAAQLLAGRKALPATDENIAAVKKTISSQDEAKKKAQRQADVAAKGIGKKEYAALTESIEECSKRIGEAFTQLDEITKQFADFGERLEALESMVVEEPDPDKEEGTDA